MALKILLADDSMTAQNMGRKILADAGYDVLPVSNGAAAIKKIASDRPDIIILDVYMPGYTGLEVCERVKGASETARIPVLLTVGKMEAFNPEEANRVRADGVMIKPFEATDLIAAIHGIANKMASSPSPHLPPSARITPPVPTLDQTMRIAPPPHQETVRIPPPKGAISHAGYEETIRLTPEQIRAFQDKTYKDWVASAEVEEEPAKPAEVAPEMPVTAAPVAEAAAVTEPEISAEPEPVIAPAASILEPVASVLEAEPESETPIMPGLDSSEAPIARAMAGAMAGHDFFTVTPPAATPESSAIAEEAPAFFVPAEDSAPAEPVFKLQQLEPEPLVPEFVAEAPAIMEPVSHELETNAPVIFEPAVTSELQELPVENLEVAAAAPMESLVADSAPELEINSPIHVQPEMAVSMEPALVTSDDDMSQFVTKFGQEGAEEVHVGLASDLPPEQLAALSMPVEEAEIVQEVPVLETPVVSYPPMVTLDEPASVVEEPAMVPSAEEQTVIDPAPVETPAVEQSFVAPEVTQAPTSVLDEVGAIEPEAALSGTGPMVAYVPGIEDTQPIPAYVEPEAEAIPTQTVEPAPTLESATTAVEPEPIVEPEPAAAISAAEPVAEEAPAPTDTIPMVEAATAAAVGGAVVAGAMHFFTPTESAPATIHSDVAEEFVPSVEAAPVETSADSVVEQEVPVEAPMEEPMGDAELAEELAKALADKEAAERAQAAAEAAISSSVEPEMVASFETAAEGEHAGFTDSKLSEAVSHALEKLRPQLIAEILKELTK